MNLRRGFTLIELLVVIAIIGVLSSVVLASLNSARMKGRDAARIAGIKEIQKALELYYLTNTSYPDLIAYATPNYDVQWTTGFVAAIQPYLPAVPRDYPVNGFLYRATNSGQKYGLATGLDSGTHTALMANDGGPMPAYYEIGPSVADCWAVGVDWWNDLPANCP